MKKRVPKWALPLAVGIGIGAALPAILAFWRVLAFVGIIALYVRYELRK